MHDNHFCWIAKFHRRTIFGAFATMGPHHQAAVGPMRYLLHSLITRQAELTPDNIALAHRDTRTSYAELSAELMALAAGLQKLGLSRGERVAVYLPKIPQAVVSFFAASAAGAVFVPVNPVLKPEQVCYILQDCNVRLLVTQHGLVSPFPIVPSETPAYMFQLVGCC